MFEGYETPDLFAALSAAIAAGQVSALDSFEMQIFKLNELLLERGGYSNVMRGFIEEIEEDNR